MKVGMISLGCCKNLVDSEKIMGLFVSGGCTIVSDASEADVLVVNTCGFIEPAKEEAINTILEMAEYKEEKKKRVNIFKMDSIMQMLFDDFKPPVGRSITDEDVAASDTDSCIYVLSRQAGEGRDRRVEKGDFLLSDIEENSLRTLRKHYKNLIVVLNCGSVMDLSVFDEIKPDAVILSGQGGAEGGNALVVFARDAIAVALARVFKALAGKKLIRRRAQGLGSLFRHLVIGVKAAGKAVAIFVALVRAKELFLLPEGPAAVLSFGRHRVKGVPGNPLAHPGLDLRVKPERAAGRLCGFACAAERGGIDLVKADGHKAGHQCLCLLLPCGRERVGCIVGDPVSNDIQKHSRLSGSLFGFPILLFLYFFTFLEKAGIAAIRKNRAKHANSRKNCPGKHVRLPVKMRGDQRDAVA